MPVVKSIVEVVVGCGDAVVGSVVVADVPSVDVVAIVLTQSRKHRNNIRDCMPICICYFNTNYFGESHHPRLEFEKESRKRDKSKANDEI